MKLRKSNFWTRLDNASKIFPATSNYRDTKVFRLVCELHDAVEPDILQEALNITIEKFPLYKSILRRGIFWYYFESSDIRPVVEIESNPVCAPIYIKDRKNLLFRVFYYNNRINAEIFHALSDGTGALWFMQTLVYHYLVLRYKEAFIEKVPDLNYNAAMSKKTEDSFKKYFTGDDIFKLMIRKIKGKKGKKAYRLKGTRTDENRMKIIEGAMSAKAVLDEAHRYNTTLTIYITSVFFYSIYKEMTARGKKHPVVLSVPINLRKIFESETARNFFGTMNISYDFSKDNADFEDIVKSVSESFQRELSKERLVQQLNKFITIERNTLARLVPLPLKDLSLRIAQFSSDRGITASISNVGRITMPQEFDPYIRQFSVFTSARRPQITMCTYGDRLVISFASPFKETDIQRTFFQFLAKKGIEIEISSNM